MVLELKGRHSLTWPVFFLYFRLPGALFSEELALGYLLLKVDRFSVDCTLGQMRLILATCSKQNAVEI